uniref:Uncharacterized protein n=1 Tax=Panagrolaimus davidi TaxID=227884 RepID=A0A914PRN7_9BILA
MVFSTKNDENLTRAERLRRNKKFLGKRTGIELGNLHAVDSQPYKKKLRSWQEDDQPETPIYSSLFFKLKDADNIPVRSYSELALDEICEILKNDKSEVNVFQALSSLYGLYAANLELFNEEFYDCIMPLIGELFKWKENVSDAFIFMLNKVFDAVSRLPAKTIWGCFDKLCEYILHGLQNEQSKFKVLSLHVLQTHIFPRCPATMNNDLYCQYLDFLSRDCIIGKVNFDVYIRDNSPKTHTETEIHDGQIQFGSAATCHRWRCRCLLGRENTGQITYSSQNPKVLFDYTFGGTVFYDVPQHYPTNTKDGIDALGSCCFEFFASIIDIEDFPLENYLYYIEYSLHVIIAIMKIYVIENNIPAGQHGKTLAEIAEDAGFKKVASKNKKILRYLRELEEI